MSLRSDIAELKKHFSGSNDVVELEMLDGATIRLQLPRGKDPVMLLYQRIIANPNCKEALLVKRAVAIIEPAGQCLILAAQALLNSPEDEPADYSRCFINAPSTLPEPEIEPDPNKVINIIQSKGNN